MNEYEKEELEQEGTAQAAPEPDIKPDAGPDAAPEESPVPDAPEPEAAAAPGEPAEADRPESPAQPAAQPEQPPNTQTPQHSQRPGYYQGGGYYAPPRDPNPWQGGQYQPPPFSQFGGSGWQQYGPTTTGWQQPQWQQPNTTGWGPQRPGWQNGGYQPQHQEEPVPGRWESAEPADTAPVKKKKRGALRVLLRLVGVAAALAVVALAGYGGYVAATGDNPLQQRLEPGNSSVADGNSGSASTVPDITINDKPFGVEDQYDGTESGTLSNTAIFKKVSPSVVGVVAQLGANVYGDSNQGSGIIMSEDGYIITNAHVVEGAVSYEVVLTNGDSYPAQLVGADRNSDLAVLKVNETGLAYAEFGNSDQLEVGERACVIGNPGGLRFQNSLTVGYISAVGRTINTGGYSIDCIQTDAAINPGNSGGPLINAYGQVVGISSAKIAQTDYEGICFAIPITDAMPILKQLIADGKVTGRAMLGITAKAVKASEAEFYEIPMGLWVDTVMPGADIGAKGVREGDIITHIADTPVYSLDACTSVLKDYKPGDTVTITVFRRESSTKDNTFKVDIVLQGS